MKYFWIKRRQGANKKENEIQTLQNKTFQISICEDESEFGRHILKEREKDMY